MRLFMIPAAMLAISFAPVQQSQARGSDVFDPPVTIDFSRTATAEFSDGAKFDAMYSGLIESTAGFPFQPGPPAEGVTVTLTHDRIQTTTYAKFAATTGRALSPPIGAQVGDERTYSRTQGNIKETWTQEYRETGGSRRWVTTSYTWERVDDKDPKSEAPN